MIESNAFYLSTIERLYFPPKLEQLQEGWCYSTKRLNTIIISPRNRNFCYLDYGMKIILGKSNVNQSFFDVIVFGCRDLTVLRVPEFIKRIGSGAFSDCNLIQYFEIPRNSELVSIGIRSFLRTNIVGVFIPKHCKIIENSAFHDCNYLQYIGFDPECELEIIGEYVFPNTFIGMQIEIPQHVKEIQHFAFNLCENMKMILFKENAEIESIGECAFAFAGLVSIVIPKTLKAISCDAFNCCKQLEFVTFQEGSQLELIADG